MGLKRLRMRGGRFLCRFLVFRGFNSCVQKAVNSGAHHAGYAKEFYNPIKEK